MLGKNYIIAATVCATVLVLGTIAVADEYQRMFAPGTTSASTPAATPVTPAETHPVLAALDSAFAAIRTAFLPGSSAIQTEMEADLVHIVTTLSSAADLTVDAVWFESDRALALERAENLRTRLQLYGLPPGRLRLAGQEGDARVTLTPVPNR